MSSAFFPIFLEKDLSKFHEILRLIFFKTRRDFEGFKTAFLHLLKLMFFFLLDGMFTTTVYSRRRGRFVNSTSLNTKMLAQKS